MTKADLIEILSKEAGVTKSSAAQLFEKVFAEILRALQQGIKVNIPGFGSFDAVNRSSREYRLPTGEMRKTSASRSARFKPSKKLKDALNS